ncbi:rab proteins geranylgeranyltransferase component A 2 [Cucumis melo var. makuwa]|uniref:Rab escort protein 1 n=2 Tax=Cucumis melo TaxID=3656 RepID=A0A5A7UEH7_CUCMM|nr:rab proteins geranylgeranyltransferase component A 2 [Cucumis melo var. makuwa]TYK11370.1 rab proteins geranylgeranyltransferase component A 2 [Cucumis melo var. makuwa]
MSDLPQHPLIDPSTFDLIVVGTGLPQSILAAAASAAGKTVLHLDPNPYYGGHFATLPLHDLTSFLNSASAPSLPSPPLASYDNQDYVSVDLQTRPLYSDVEISSYAPEVLQEHARKFNIDLAGPRVLFCADKCIDAVLKVGVNQYLEFKSIDASYLWDPNGKLVNVPGSRAAIFKDKSLSLTEKNQLMRFFKLVQQHLDPAEDSENSKISQEDLDTPFLEFLNKLRLPQKMKSIILYAISLANDDQNDHDVGKNRLLTKEGIARLALYHTSIGRFQNAQGALLYPIYGQGELSQAFCRRAAVKGCLYVLRMPVVALLKDKSNEQYKGVRLASGQDIFSQQLVLDPCFIVPQLFKLSLESLQDVSLRDVNRKVARGICITKRSLVSDVKNCLLVYPPKTLFPEQVSSVRVLQIGGNLAVCPEDMFVIYISTLCDNANQGKEMVREAMNAIMSLFVSDCPDSSSVDQDTNAEGKELDLLWSALYVQESSVGQFGTVSFTPMPDGNLNYDDLLDATFELFQKMYPNEELFLETTSAGVHQDDGEES